MSDAWKEVADVFESMFDQMAEQVTVRGQRVFAYPMTRSLFSVSAKSEPGITLLDRTPFYARSVTPGSKYHVVLRAAAWWSFDRERPPIAAIFHCQTSPLFDVQFANDLDALEDEEVAVCRRCAFMLVAAKVGALPWQQYVYYARRDGPVKIGFSNNVGLRTCRLGTPPVAAEPGGRELERERHEQFKHLALGGEWFKPEDDLLAHIDAVRDAHGAPREKAPA